MWLYAQVCVEMLFYLYFNDGLLRRSLIKIKSKYVERNKDNTQYHNKGVLRTFSQTLF